MKLNLFNWFKTHYDDKYRTNDYEYYVPYTRGLLHLCAAIYFLKSCIYNYRTNSRSGTFILLFLAFWKKAKEDKFFAFNFPEKYGGVPMSSTGQSSLLQRISSCSAVGSVHVMVPNLLGPGELLTHYGSK